MADTSPAGALLDELHRVANGPRPLTGVDLDTVNGLVDRLATMRSPLRETRPAVLDAAAKLVTAGAPRDLLERLVRLARLPARWEEHAATVLTNPAVIAEHGIDPVRYAADLTRAADPVNHVIRDAAGRRSFSTWREPAGATCQVTVRVDHHLVSCVANTIELTSVLVDLVEHDLDPVHAAYAKQTFCERISDDRWDDLDLFAEAAAAHRLATR